MTISSKVKLTPWHKRLARLLLATTALLSAQLSAAAIEEPGYAVVRREGVLELRDYAPYMLAETRVQANFDDAGNQAFRRLFKYISGDNRQQQSISMTAPVTQRSANEAPAAGASIAMTAPVNQVADGDAFRVGFVVPSKFTRATVPAPNDPRVSIREVPAQRVAAWRFSGRWTEVAFKEAEASLRQGLTQLGYQAIGPAVTARYNGPFSLPFARRNEVLIPVRPIE